MGRSKKMQNTAKTNRVASKLLADKVNKPNRQTVKGLRATTHTRSARRGG